MQTADACSCRDNKYSASRNVVKLHITIQLRFLLVIKSQDIRREKEGPIGI